MPPRSLSHTGIGDGGVACRVRFRVHRRADERTLGNGVPQQDAGQRESERGSGSGVRRATVHPCLGDKFTDFLYSGRGNDNNRDIEATVTSGGST
ncbi:unnamed protein product [Gadus morhua 'NCC']